MTRIRLAGIAVFAALASFHSSAHDVITTQITFSREISRLMYGRCVSCHREGGSAFSLVKYEEARPWAKAIKEEVLERRMPPCGAVKGFGQFRDDRGLTQEQLELIAEWVEGGAPEGDSKYLPGVPHLEEAVPVLPKAGIPVADGFTLKSPVSLAGIGVKDVAEGASFMVVAERPDGAVEPLLWLYGYNPKFAHPFWYSAPVKLPAGARISVAPAWMGGVVLLTKRRLNQN